MTENIKEEIIMEEKEIKEEIIIIDKVKPSSSLEEICTLDVQAEDVKMKNTEIIGKV